MARPQHAMDPVLKTISEMEPIQRTIIFQVLMDEIVPKDDVELRRRLTIISHGWASDQHHAMKKVNS